MALPYSSGPDRAFIQPGPAGSVWTSAGPTLNPYWGPGSTGGAIQDVSGNYAVLPTDSIIHAKGPNNQIITLPITGLIPGQEFTIVASGQGKPIVVAVPTGSSINKVSSFTLSTEFSSIIVQWDGTKYFIAAAYLPAAEVILISEMMGAVYDPWLRVRPWPVAVYEASGGIYAFEQKIASGGVVVWNVIIEDSNQRARPWPVAVQSAAGEPFLHYVAG